MSAPFPFLNLHPEIQYKVLDFITDIHEKFRLRRVNGRFRDLVDTKESWQSFNRLEIEKKQFYSHYILNGCKVFENNIYDAVSDLCQRITVTDLRLNASPEVGISPEALARLIHEIHRPENRAKLKRVELQNSTTFWILPSLIAFSPNLEIVNFERGNAPLTLDQSVMFWYAINLGDKLRQFSYKGAGAQDMESHKMLKALTGKPVQKLHLDGVGHLYTEPLLELCESLPTNLKSLTIKNCPNVSALKLLRHLSPYKRRDLRKMQLSFGDDGAMQHFGTFLHDLVPDLESCVLVKEGEEEKFSVESTICVLGQILASAKQGKPERLTVDVRSESNALVAIGLLRKNLCKKIEIDIDFDGNWFVATNGEAVLAFPDC